VNASVSGANTAVADGVTNGAAVPSSPFVARFERVVFPGAFGAEVLGSTVFAIKFF
jgi:hypothetical protein